ncbi:MAG: sulfotransferase [Candidatus Accumulibacter phosphatis]|nr:sulfotransferase [Candidatus Accumulibacter phosphatis]
MPLKKPATAIPVPWYVQLLPYRLRRRWLVGSKRFVIVSHPRSGSNFLRDALNSHPDAFEFGEAFHGNPAVSIYPAQVLGKGQLPYEDLDSLMDKLATERQVEATGFALFSQAKGHLLDYQAAATLASRPDIHVIFLVRRNLLKAYVSLQRALLTGFWHVDTTGIPVAWEHASPLPDAGERTIGPVDIAEAREWIAETRAFLAHVEQAAAASGKICHRVHYENLCLASATRSLDEVNRTLGYLGLRKLERYEPTLGRTTDRTFYDSIPNRDALVRELGFDLD